MMPSMITSSIKLAPLLGWLICCCTIQLLTCCVVGFSSPSTTTRHHNYYAVHDDSFTKRGVSRTNDGVIYPCSNKQWRCSNIASSRYAAATKTSKSSSLLQMGLLDFLSSRTNDFIPLQKSDDETYGPGPLIILYEVPSSMDDEELLDIIEDGMPNRKRGEVILQCISGMDDSMNNNNANDDDDDDDGLLDLTVKEALDKVMGMQKSDTIITYNAKPTIIAIGAPSTTLSYQELPCPVLYFSGVTNTEMMDTYNIIANEIYEETGGVHWPACAKVVPPAMQKSIRQVLTEISGDHEDAMRIRREEAEKAANNGG